MRSSRTLIAGAVILATAAIIGPAGAAPAMDPQFGLSAAGPSTVFQPPARLLMVADLDPATDPGTAPGGSSRPVAIEYSDSYNLRREVHYIASFATLPLFAAEYALGAKLYDGSASSSVRSAHGVVAGSIAVLFGVNTLTGTWNLVEGRHDPSGRTRRILHGALMIVADAGFVATGMLAPDSEEGSQPVSTSDKNAHRNVAIGSMGVATVSYLIMLIGR